MHQLSKSTAAYQLIRQRILALEADVDERTLADTVEGLTDLHEVLAAVVRSAILDEAMAEGLKVHIGTLQDRLQRLTDRATKRRQIARDTMLEVDIKKITTPDFTVSVRAGVPALVVADQAAIPADYWIPREPRLDRLALVDALKRGTVVAGAQLSNPEPVLSVRVK